MHPVHKGKVLFCEPVSVTCMLMRGHDANVRFLLWIVIFYKSENTCLQYVQKYKLYYWDIKWQGGGGGDGELQGSKWERKTTFGQRLNTGSWWGEGTAAGEVGSWGSGRGAECSGQWWVRFSAVSWGEESRLGAECEQDYPDSKTAAPLLEWGESWGLRVLWDGCCISVSSFPVFSSLFLDLLLFRYWISWLDLLIFFFLFSTSLPFLLDFLEDFLQLNCPTFLLNFLFLLYF